MARLVLALLLFAFALPARADLCWWLTREQAERGATLLKPGAEFVEYCEPCRDRPPTHARTVAASSAGHFQGRPGHPPDPTGWAVTVNGRERDLAYLYVRRGTNWENVAMAAGCPVHDVKPTFAFPPEAAADQAGAKASAVRCTIRSKGVVAFDGPCRFEVEAGGSFTVSTTGARGALYQEVVSVSVGIVSTGEAEVGGLTAAGVSFRWGEAKRSKADPACWAGADFEVCARRVPGGR